MLIKRLLCVLLLMWSSIATSADGVVVDSDKETIELTAHLFQWKETAAMPSGAFIGSAENVEWQPVGDKYNKGYISDAYWYRLTLSNPQSDDLLRLLEIEYPLLDQIDFYTIAYEESGPKLQQHYITGDRRDYDERPIHGRTFVFPLTLKAGQTYDIYFRVSSASSHQVSTRLWNFDAYIEYTNEDSTFRATYYGSQLMLIVFMIGLYLLMRRRVYLLFGATLLGLLTLQAALHGVLFQYVLPQWPLLHEYVILTCVPFILIMMLWFSSDYLDLRRNHHGWYKIYRIATTITVLALLSVFFLPYRQATSVGVLLAVPVTLLTVWTGVRLWSQGTKTARIFTLSWMALLAGCLIAILNQLGVLVIEGASQYSIPLGASVQSILMAYALADRFQKDRNDKVKAQEARFDALKQQRDTERAMMRNATRHQVTQLCNRQIYEQVLNQQLQHYRKSPDDGHLAIVLWHIQSFNDFQKTLGHENGERLVRTAAQRLNSVAKEIPEVVLLDRDDEITVANVETVTFGAILRSPNIDTIKSIANQLANTLRQPINFKRLNIEFAVQTGCAFSDTQMDVSTLQRHAFIAFGHNLPVQASVTVYESGMDSYSPRRLTLMGELKTAIDDDTLALYFQPQLDLQTRQVVGFEALLRWHHKEYGFIPPDEFIPFAEETGLIREVTGWVAKQACQFVKKLEQQGCDATVSINISAGNLHDTDFIEQLTHIVEAASVSPGQLILEVTETAAMEDRDVALSTLTMLHEAGFKLSIDDFGTGYSSLQYLDDLPVDEVKIDRSFVQKMEGEDADDTIIKATITIGHELGFKVLAEGVETADIRDCLAAKGCDLAQGYYFAKPQASDDILNWLADYQKNQ